MSATDTAYRTADPAVVEAWTKYKADAESLSERRRALSETVGRNLMVNRKGFGHGTRVVGFERFESDVPGTTLLDGSLRVYKSDRAVRPNLRTKRGKDMDSQLQALASPTLALPGMPSFHLTGDGDTAGIRSAAPALWEWDGVIYALWPCTDAPVKDNWEPIPLSTYYLAHEQMEQANADQG